MVGKIIAKPVFIAASCVAGPLLSTSARAADADSLVGIHWWGLLPGQGSYAGGVDDQPAQMMDSVNRGGWDVEVVNTHGPVWQQAGFFEPLYSALPGKGVSTVTRVEYEYGKTVPSTTTIDTGTWASDHVVPLVNTLKAGGHLWQLGNEPNLNGEGNGWANNQVTPAGYASVYNSVRATIQSNAQASPQGAHKVLVAPVSPGDVIGGVRWKSGNDWLSETIDAIGPANIDGFALHAYGGGGTTADAIRDFRRGFAEQIAIIDAKGLTNVPLYITEWNRYANPNAADAAQQEAAAADFAREAFKVVNDWNHRPGNHNVVSMSWFVYDPGGAQDGNGAWDGYGIEYWKNHGNPAGDPGDLYTAFHDAARQGYRAGLPGARPLPNNLQVLQSFEGSTGRGSAGGFDKTVGFSPQTQGLRVTEASGPNSFTVVTADDSFAQSFSQKLGLWDKETDPLGWTFRHSSFNGVAASNGPISLTAGPGNDGSIGFWLRVLTSSGDTSTLAASIIVDTNSGGGDDTDQGVPRAVIADGAWHFYEWSLDNDADWQTWLGRDGVRITGDGLLPDTGTISFDSLWLTGGNGANVEYFFDGVMHYRDGSIGVMIPEPSGAGLLLIGAIALRRRRQ